MWRTLEQIGVRAGIIYVALLALMSVKVLGLRATPGYAPDSPFSAGIASAIGLREYPLHAEIVFRLLIAVIGGVAVAGAATATAVAVTREEEPAISH